MQSNIREELWIQSPVYYSVLDQVMLYMYAENSKNSRLKRNYVTNKLSAVTTKGSLDHLMKDCCKYSKVLKQLSLTYCTLFEKKTKSEGVAETWNYGTTLKSLCWRQKLRWRGFVSISHVYASVQTTLARNLMFFCFSGSLLVLVILSFRLLSLHYVMKLSIRPLYSKK